MKQQASVTDPTLFAVLRAVRSTARQMRYSVSVLRCGCQTALHELDMDRSPAVAHAQAVLAMERRNRLVAPQAAGGAA